MWGITKTPIDFGAGASPLLTDLISYWKLDEASGTRNDSHGTSHLTDNNTVTAAAGKIGNAAQFVIANAEFLQVADNASFGFTTAMSVAFWINRAVLTAFETYIAKWTYATDGEWIIRASATAADVGVLLATSATDNGAGCEMRFADGDQLVDTWYHMVVVFDGSQTGDAARLKVYQNGIALTLSVFAGAVPASLRNGTANLNFGKWGGSETQYLGGLMDEVGLWNRPLTADEVTQLYNSGNGVTYPGFV